MRCECGGALFLGKCEDCGREEVASPKLVTRVSFDASEQREWSEWGLATLSKPLHTVKEPAETWHFEKTVEIVAPEEIDDQVDESGPAAGETRPPLPTPRDPQEDGLVAKALALHAAEQRITQLEDENLALRTALSENGAWEERARAAIERAEAAEDEAARLRDALTEAPMYALGRTNGDFARWCLKQAQPAGEVAP